MSLINFTEITDGNTAQASDVNTPLNTIYDEFNGNIDQNNIKPGGVSQANLNSSIIYKTQGPAGFLINGRLSVTVSSNNITVAIKTLDGSDPTSTNPVYCRIGNTVREIISGLSVTKNAGTNYFGKGASYFAANESDYFVYLTYNTNTSAVDIGFSSIPSGRTYADFSSTATVWNHWAGNATAPAATDEVVNIGRFGATLSAAASHNWSVPTFTPTNLIQRPIYETRLFSFTNSGTGGGTFYYRQVEALKEVFGVMGSRSITGSGFQSTTGSVVLPTGFFTALTMYHISPGVLGATIFQASAFNTVTTNQLDTYHWQASGANGSQSSHLLVRGT